MEASLLFRTMAESDLDRILTCLEIPPSDHPATALSRIKGGHSINSTTRERFIDYLSTRNYRPEWTWLALDGDEIAGLAVWWGFPAGGNPLALDCLYAAPSVAAPVPLWAELIRRVPPPIEYHIFTVPGGRDDPAIKVRLEAAAAAGLTTLNERLRYEWTAEKPLPDRSSRLRFEPDPDDEAFIDVFAAISVDSLDVATREGVERLGHRANAEEDVAHDKMMKGSREDWRLAYDEAGDLVGFALPSANDGGPVVGYLGVVPGHRGHGCSDDLLAEITWILAANGATRIRADTDSTNRPMAAAFDRAGYQVHGIRLVSS
jgi:RimJ/RimL family protein N-acetyltransferase